MIFTNSLIFLDWFSKLARCARKVNYCDEDKYLYARHRPNGKITQTKI